MKSTLLSCVLLVGCSGAPSTFVVQNIVQEDAAVDAQQPPTADAGVNVGDVQTTLDAGTDAVEAAALDAGVDVQPEASPSEDAPVDVAPVYYSIKCVHNGAQYWTSCDGQPHDYIIEAGATTCTEQGNRATAPCNVGDPCTITFPNIPITYDGKCY